MSGYTIVWKRRPAFDDDGQRKRLATSLAEARVIMQMAFVAEPGFRAVSITDSTGRHYPFLLEDPLVSEQDYLTYGLEYYDEWIAQPTGDLPAPPDKTEDRPLTLLGIQPPDGFGSEGHRPPAGVT